MTSQKLALTPTEIKFRSLPGPRHPDLGSFSLQGLGLASGQRIMISSRSSDRARATSCRESARSPDTAMPARLARRYMCVSIYIYIYIYIYMRVYMYAYIYIYYARSPDKAMIYICMYVYIYIYIYIYTYIYIYIHAYIYICNMRRACERGRCASRSPAPASWRAGTSPRQRRCRPSISILY